MARKAASKKGATADQRVDDLFSGTAAQAPPADQGTAAPGTGPADQAPPPLFGGTDDQAGGDFPPLPNLKRGFEAIVDRIYDEGLDVVEEFETIERSLTIDGALTPGAIQIAANNTEEMARRAYRLYVVAKHEHEAYVRETDAIVGALREAATAKLEKEKAAKTRTKMITDADVVGTAAQLYPDEWRRVNDRRDRAKGMLDVINNLAALAKSRCFTVSNMLSPGGKL